MAITYSWKVDSMNARDEGDLENAVVQVYWTKTGVDEDGVEGSCPGESTFSTANIAAEEFIPFDELTEEIVIGWIQSTINPSYHEGIDEQIQTSIDRNRNPIKNLGLPWASTPAVEPPPGIVEDPTLP